MDKLDKVYLPGKFACGSCVKTRSDRWIHLPTKIFKLPMLQGVIIFSWRWKGKSDKSMKAIIYSNVLRVFYVFVWTVSCSSNVRHCCVRPLPLPEPDLLGSLHCKVGRTRVKFHSLRILVYSKSRKLKSFLWGFPLTSVLFYCTPALEYYAVH